MQRHFGDTRKPYLRLQFRVQLPGGVLRSGLWGGWHQLFLSLSRWMRQIRKRQRHNSKFGGKFECYRSEKSSNSYGDNLGFVPQQTDVILLLSCHYDIHSCLAGKQFSKLANLKIIHTLTTYSFVCSFISFRLRFHLLTHISRLISFSNLFNFTHSFKSIFFQYCSLYCMLFDSFQ